MLLTVHSTALHYDCPHSTLLLLHSALREVYSRTRPLATPEIRGRTRNIMDSTSTALAHLPVSLDSSSLQQGSEVLSTPFPCSRGPSADGRTSGPFPGPRRWSIGAMLTGWMRTDRRTNKPTLITSTRLPILSWEVKIRQCVRRSNALLK